MAQANDERNRRLREAFGIGEFNQKDIKKQKAEEAKEAERKKVELAQRQYTFVRENVRFFFENSSAFQCLESSLMMQKNLQRPKNRRRNENHLHQPVKVRKRRNLVENSA